MPTFEPPTQLQGCDDIFWGRYSIPVGQSVVMRDGHYRTTPTPWIGELDGLVDGVDYFLGGHIYEVSDEVADRLEGDGFTVDRTAGYGYAPYGEREYGE